MNRIILIGNGFDLAHGLPTSYKNFIDYYWETRVDALCRCDSNTFSDGLSTLSIKDKSQATRYGELWNRFISSYNFSNQTSSKEMIRLIKEDSDNFVVTMTSFFRGINMVVEQKNWVDIENEYYKCLKSILNKNTYDYKSPVQIDTELNKIREELIAYLKSLQDETINESIKDDTIQNTIFEPFCVDDISIAQRKDFMQFIEARWEYRKNPDSFKQKFLCSKYGYSMFNLMPDLTFYESETTDIDKHKDNILNRRDVPDYFLLPDDVLLLNFNYTRTAELYVPRDSGIQVNYIHGSLTDPEKIIFGYGDELDEDYKKISNLNDNDYLQNIKSIRYLETDNYRRLLAFIDSAPFQIYIMGHSCGNSDRTLLNTLFEHKNCVSIKPFYHKKEDGGDNYIKIIQNISRNFNDMQMMRDRVVNKTYCRHW